MTIIFVLFAVLLIHYLYFLAEVYFGLKKLPSQSRSEKIFEKVSLIIPLRNEEDNVNKLCLSLTSQSIDAAAYEIIFVNDNSTDNTLDYLERYKPVNARIISLSDSSGETGRKKKAVIEGIKSAQNSIIVVTDADCEHRETWIETILSYFEDDTGIVAGPVDYIENRSLFKKFQRLEFAGLILTGAGLIGYEKPTICSAANLAYRKKVFEEVGGFETELNFSSGDDDLFLQKVAAKTKYKIKYAFNPNALVKTKPKENVTDFLEQRKRWASKNLFYESKTLVVRIILLVLFYLGLVAQLILGIFIDSTFLILFFLSLIFKMMFEFFILNYGTKIIYVRKIMSVFFIAEIFQIPYIIYSSIAGLFGNFKWKGERVKR